MKRIELSSLFLGVISGIGLFAGVGCGGGTTAGNPTIDSSASEIGVSTVSGAANASEPGGTQASYFQTPRKTFAHILIDALTPIRSSFAANACPTILDTACSSGAVALNYSECTFGISPTLWSGSQTISFSSGCPTSLLAIAQYNGQTLTRVFGTGTTETTWLGVKTTLDTASAATSGWDSSISVGSGEQAHYTDTSGGRTLSILGIHLHADTSGGTTLFDHTVSSTGLTVAGHGTSRVITGGPVTVQHNLAKYTAQVQISSPLTYTMSACCHPTSGAVTSTLSGSVSGTETLTFTGAQTGKCGTATLVNSSGSSSDVTLSHCF